MTVTDLNSTTSVQNWRQSYRIALFETDEQKLPLRVAEAEKALIRRAKELFALSGNNIEEELAVQDAMYAMRALRHCLELKTRQCTAA
jgi:hypothetical protein